MPINDALPDTVICQHVPAVLRGNNFVHPHCPSVTLPSNFPLLMDCGDSYQHFFVFSYHAEPRILGLGIPTAYSDGKLVTHWTTLQGAVGPATETFTDKDLILEVTRLGFIGHSVNCRHFGLVRAPFLNRSLSAINSAVNRARIWPNVEMDSVVFGRDRGKLYYGIEFKTYNLVPPNLTRYQPY